MIRSKFIIKPICKSLILFLLIIITLILFVFLFFSKDDFVIAGENLGGWAYNSYYGWFSESCNNMYGEIYDNYCRIDIDPILDVSFDGDNIDLDSALVKDTMGNFDGKLINFYKSDVRNGGKSRNSGLIRRDSNFDNSLYFNGWNSYINFDNQRELSFDDSPFTISLWFKIDPDSVGEKFLFSNGIDMSQRYHCWIDSTYHLNCMVNNQKSEIEKVISTDKWNNISVVYENNDFLIYLNGYLEKEINTGQVSPLPSVQELILGANGNYNSVFQGELDEFRFFEAALNSEQILRNTKYNSNYLLNIEEETGLINGWMWSDGIGWMCFGNTCAGTTPKGGYPEAKLHWLAEGNNIYPHMITGWANAVAFNDAGQSQYQDAGWLSLQGEEIMIANYDKYSNCISCNFRDEEDDLVLYLKMDEDSGDIAIDYSGFLNNGNLLGFDGSPWNSEGRVNNCLSFDGQDDFLDINVSENDELNLGAGDFSIEIWVKNEKTKHLFEDHLSIISGKSDQKWELYFNPEFNMFIFEIFGKIVKGNFSNIDEWSHIVVVVDRDGDLKMYVNNLMYIGEDISSFAEKNISNQSFLIGKSSNSSFFWDGFIDIVRIYRKALNEQEIDYNYNFPEKRFCSACLDQTLNKIETNKICYKCEWCNLEDNTNNCKSCSDCRQYGLAFDTNTSNIKGYAWGGVQINDELTGLGWFQFSPTTGAGLYRSYVSSKYGDIYSKSNIGSDYTVVPPVGYFNATYMIQANGHIMNWISSSYEENNDWLMSSDTGNPLSYEYPKLENDYGNVLGSLDYSGLINGFYGEVIEELPGQGGISYDVCLEDKIYYLKGADIKLTEKLDGLAYRFENCTNAAGIIIVDGDLIVEGNIKYDTNTFSGSSDNLASVAWIIKGDLKISPNVTSLAGTFIVLGEDNVDCGYDLEKPTESCGSVFTCNADSSECGNQLKVSGQFLAKNFIFGRTFRSLESELREAAEEIIYDGRNVINPPPGLGDILKSLPTWNQIAPY